MRRTKFRLIRYIFSSSRVKDITCLDITSDCLWSRIILFSLFIFLLQVNICVDLDVQVQRMEEVICVNELYVKKATGIVMEEEESRSSGSLTTGSTKVDWKSFSM